MARDKQAWLSFTMPAMTFEPGSRVRIPQRPDLPGYVRIELAMPVGDGWQLFVEEPTGGFQKVELTREQATACEILTQDGGGAATAVLAGLWTVWMGAATTGARSAALASSPLKPYAHQMNAVYGAMLPQPNLRFLLADEPGTGKTIMAGMYLREMQRLGFVRRALVVAPAHLVTKWQADFERFFGGGLRRITAHTVREHALETDHDLWIVSLDLAAVNPAVQDAIRPDLAGWDAVVLDEAHRLTPTAASYYQAGELLALNTPRVLFMTATPHRGKEWLFRALLHLVDPDVFPPVAARRRTHSRGETGSRALPATHEGRPRRLRRGHTSSSRGDGQRTRLCRSTRPRATSTLKRSTSWTGTSRANAVPLGRMVYGKRAASSLYALAETLKRRRDGMGTAMPAAAALLRRTRTETTLPRRTRRRSSSSRPKRRSRSARRSTVCSLVSSRS